MNLDPKTVVILLTIGIFFISVGLLNISRNYVSMQRDIRIAAFAGFIQLLGWILIVERGKIPDYFSYVIGNSLLILSLTRYLYVITRFKGKKLNPFLLYLPLTFCFLGMTYFTVIDFNYKYDVIIVTSTACLITYAIAALLISFSPDRNPTHQYTGISIFIGGTISFIRMIVDLFYFEQYDSHFAGSNFLHDMLFISYFLFGILFPFSILLMYNDRYISQRILAESRLSETLELLEETNKVALIGNWEVNFITGKVYWSDTLKTIHEVPENFSPAFGQGIESIVEEDRENIRQQIMALRKEPGSFDIDTQIRTDKGNVKWVNFAVKSEFQGNTCKRILGITKDITQRVEAREAARLVEEQYKNAFEYSAIGIGISRLDFKWEAINQQLLNIIGYTREELNELTFKDITHPDDLDLDLNFVKQLNAGEIKSFSMEKRYIHKNGSIIWVFLAVSAVRDTQNNILKYIAHVADISEKKKIEQELFLKQQQYKSLFDNNPDSVVSLDLNGNFTNVNDRMLEIAGCSREEIIGKNFSVFHQEEENLQEVSKFFHDSKGFESMSFETAITNLQGREYILNITHLPITIDGKMVGIYGISQDVTVKRKIEQDLIAAKEKLNALLENISDVITLLDADGNITYVSASAKHTFGYEEHELLEKNIQSMLHPNELEFLVEKFNTYVGGKDDISGKIRHRLQTRSGDYIYVETHWNNQLSNPNICGIVLSSRDITEQINSSLVLQKSEQQLRDVQKIARVGNFSYDYRTGNWNSSSVIYDILGISADAIRTYTIEDWKGLLAKDHLQDFLTTYQSAIVEGKLSADNKYDIKIIRPSDGKTCWMSLTAEIEYECNGIPRMLQGTIQDITERKTTEERLEQSERKYRQIVETTEESIAIIDKTNKLTFVNKVVCEKTQYTEEELLGKDTQELVAGSKDIIMAALQKRNLGINGSNEIRFIRRDGSVIWFNISATPIYDEQGAYDGALIMATDITESKLANELIQESEIKYHNLFSTNPLPIIIWDLNNFEVIEANDAAFKEFGYEPEEFMHMNVLDLHPEEERLPLTDFVKEMRTTEQYKTKITWKKITKTGNIMFLNTTLYRFIYNKRLSVLTISENVTEKIKIEEDLKNSYREIRELTRHLHDIREKEQARIAREIHDELGQQLTVLKINANLLKGQADLMPPQTVEMANQMIEMIDQSIKSVKKISSELRPSILDDLGLVAALEWLAKEFQKKTTINCNFYAYCNAVEFSDDINTAVFRIFQESLTNVARHAQASKVIANLYTNENELILQIEDNGIGISGESKEKKKSFGLLGMKERATMLNGKIQVENVNPAGTRVTLRIPV